MLLLAVVAAPALTGCMLFTTKREGQQLHQKVEALQARLDKLKAQEKATLEALTRARKELLALKDILPRARRVLLANSARFGLRLDKLTAQVGKIQGLLENLQADRGGDTKTLKKMAQETARLKEELLRLKTALTQQSSRITSLHPQPKTAAELFAAGQTARLTGRLPAARRFYQALIRRFPRDKRVEAARFYIARTHFDAYDYAAAVVAIARLLKLRPKGRFAPRARLLSAQSYFALKRCRTARRILTRLIRVFPNAGVASEGRLLLQRLRRVQRVARYCRR